MRRRVASFIAVSTLTAAGLAVSASPAAANRPTRVFENTVTFVCESGVTNEFGTAQVTAEDHSEFGSSGSILYWVAPDSPDTGEATFRSSSLITDQQVTRTGYHFDGVLLMEDQDFNPVGNATFSVDLIPTGRVDEATPARSRFGNRTIHDRSSVKFFSVVGTVTMHDGTVFDLTGCGGPDGSGPDTAGFDTTIDVRVTDPSQFVISFSGVLVLCDVVTPGHALNLGASSENGPQTELQFTDESGTLFGFSDEITLTAEEFSGTVPLSHEDGEPAGDAVIDVTFTRGDHIVVRTENGSIRSRQIGYLLEPAGSITFPTGTVVDLSSCFAFDGTEQQKEHRPRE